MSAGLQFTRYEDPALSYILRSIAMAEGRHIEVSAVTTPRRIELRATLAHGSVMASFSAAEARSIAQELIAAAAALEG